MTLKEAIERAEKEARRCERASKANRKHGGTFYEDKAAESEQLAKENIQFAAWLRELEACREEMERCSERMERL